MWLIITVNQLTLIKNYLTLNIPEHEGGHAYISQLPASHWLTGCDVTELARLQADKQKAVHCPASTSFRDIP